MTQFKLTTLAALLAAAAIPAHSAAIAAPASTAPADLNAQATLPL